MARAAPSRSSDRTAARLAGALLLAVLLPGCLSVRRELDAEQARQQAAWTALNAAPPAPLRTFTWDTALAQLRSGSAKLRAADLEVQRSREALDQVRRSLIPLVNVQSGYNRALDESANGGFDPFYFAATLFFDVPGVINFRVRHEAALLAFTRARLAHEAIWREQVIALYRLAVQAAPLAARAADLDREQTRAHALAATAPRTAAAARHRLAPLQAQLAAQESEWQTKTADLLGLPGTRVTFTGELPPPGYDDPAARPAPETLAQLPLRLAAVELVALRARQLGVRLQAWPELNVGVSSPALYRRNSGQADYWSSSDVLVGVNAFWTLDTQGRQASQRRLLETEQAFRREALTQEARRVSAQLRTALDRLRATDADDRRLAAALRAAPPSLRAELTARRDAVAAERRDWQIVLWYFDDSRWTAPTLVSALP